MTAPQLQSLLRWAIRYIARENDWHRKKPPCERKSPSAVQVAKTDMFLSRARKAIAKPKAARKPK